VSKNKASQAPGAAAGGGTNVLKEALVEEETQEGATAGQLVRIYFQK